MSYIEAYRMGLAIDGPKALTRTFPKWFDLYPFAHIGPAAQATAGGRQLRILRQR